ncbi:MAG: SOS response-associated peptidase [Candidatus Korobacteraceae bacterium]|jgi:putative SOS response-associated peptidase YedK
MCGRYRLSRRAEILASHFCAEYEGMDWEARYNIAPTQAVPVIRQDPREAVRRASLMRWGLIPSWANDATISARMINARSETAAEKPAFRESLQRRRCLIPADGFYEWPRRAKAKQPFHFGLQDDSLFAFAGLWDRWRGPDSTTLETCTILTTTPNQLLADVHDRMPVILPPTSYDLWLDPGFRELAATTEMLKPYDAGQMRRYAVSTRVNSVANDDRDCSESTDVSGAMQAGLF